MRLFLVVPNHKSSFRRRTRSRARRAARCDQASTINATVEHDRAQSPLHVTSESRQGNINTARLPVAGDNAVLIRGYVCRIDIATSVVDAAFDLEFLAAWGVPERTVTLRTAQRRLAWDSR